MAKNRDEYLPLLQENSSIQLFPPQSRKRKLLLVLSVVFGICSFSAVALFAYANTGVENGNPERTLQLQAPQAEQQNGLRAMLPGHVQRQLNMAIPRMAKKNVERKRRPNIFVFLADDLGYGDLASYGHPSQPWGPLDEMASKGVRFTNFYADSFCTPSRAQFLTGRLAVRSGMQGFNPRVLVPQNPGGLPDSEITIAEMLKDAGYVTGLNGKWHMGVNCERPDDGCHLPFHHGFDEVGTYFPISNNLVCDETGRYSAYPDPQICFLYQGKGTTPWQAPVYHENLTELYVNEIKDFITRNREREWFFNFASPQTHDVMYSSARFRGSTMRGDFGDALAEMSWAAGEIVRHIVSLGLAEDTLFLFFSDNGAPTTDCLQAGNNGHMAEGKGTSWEGGIRVPAFVYWPGAVEPGLTSHALLTSADLFPTFARLARAPLPTDRILDGRDMSDWLVGEKGEQSIADRDRALFFYCGEEITAVRYKGFKLHYKTFARPDFSCINGQPEFVRSPVQRVLARQNCNDSKLIHYHNPPLLFNIQSDPSEKFSLQTADYKEIRSQDNGCREVVRKQEENRVSVPNQLQGYKYRLTPCCDRSRNCVCNYPYPERLKIPQSVVPCQENEAR